MAEQVLTQCTVGGPVKVYIEDGKITEEWIEMDMMSMMQPLGVVPQPK